MIHKHRAISHPTLYTSNCEHFGSCGQPVFFFLSRNKASLKTSNRIKLLLCLCNYVHFILIWISKEGIFLRPHVPPSWASSPTSGMCPIGWGTLLQAAVLTNYMELSTNRQDTVAKPLENFPTFYETRRFITAFTRALHLSLFWVRPMQSILPHPRPSLLLSTNLRLGLPN
jgi:hypothetical protein